MIFSLSLDQKKPNKNKTKKRRVDGCGCQFYQSKKLREFVDHVFVSLLRDSVVVFILVKSCKICLCQYLVTKYNNNYRQAKYISFLALLAGWSTRYRAVGRTRQGPWNLSILWFQIFSSTSWGNFTYLLYRCKWCFCNLYCRVRGLKVTSKKK